MLQLLELLLDGLNLALSVWLWCVVLVAVIIVGMFTVGWFTLR